MIKKMSSLMLALMMVLVTLAANVTPVRAAATAWDGQPIDFANNQRKELPEGALTLTLAEEEKEAPLPQDPYKFVPKSATSTKMDVGDEFYLGVKFDMQTGITGNPIHRITATFDYDREYFETVQPGDVRVVDTVENVPRNQAANQNLYKYVRGWDPDAGILSIEYNNNWSKAKTGETDAFDETGDDQMLIVIHMTVKKAVDDDLKRDADKNLIRDASGNCAIGKNIYDDTTKALIRTEDGYADAHIFGLRQITAMTNDAPADFAGWYSKLNDNNPLSVANTWTLETGKNDQDSGRHLTLATEGINDTGVLEQRPGEVIAVPVYADENTGFNKLKLEATWNKSFLVLKSVTLSPELRVYADLTVDSMKDTDYEKEQVVYVSVTSAKDIKLDSKAKLFNFNFEVKDTAKENAEAKVSINVRQVGNSSDTNMKGATYDNETGAKLTLGGAAVNEITRDIKVLNSYNYGDVNADGYVNLVDAAMLLQFYNGIRSLDVKQTHVGNVDGSDENNNSRGITLVDILMIMRAYNNGVVGEINSYMDNPYETSTP